MLLTPENGEKKDLNQNPSCQKKAQITGQCVQTKRKGYFVIKKGRILSILKRDKNNNEMPAVPRKEDRGKAKRNKKRAVNKKFVES